MSRPADGSLPGDPFWDVVQRRHPDVDIVILPSTTPDRERVPDVTSLAEAQQSGRELDAAFEEAWSLLLHGHPMPASELRWMAGSGPGVAAPARSARLLDLPPDLATRLVATADDALTARAWRTTPATGGLQRVTATAGGLTITLSAHEDTCRLEVRGPDIRVGHRALRTLRRQTAS